IFVWDTETGQRIWTLKGYANSVRSLAWPHDGRWLAALAVTEVKILDPATGECVSTRRASDWNRIVQFRTTNSKPLHTGFGTFIFDSLLQSTTADPSNHRVSLVGTGWNMTWITHREERLWLPPEYRPSSAAISGTWIAIGCASVRILFLRFADSSPTA
ncbi:hypothetical protein L209DRAFT_687254, partial [Thermothelomyces heterothallicus CBS 203.75]